MLLSRSSQYTLQALIYLARQPPGERVMIKDIAEKLELPLFYLGKLIQVPARVGWLVTVRGRGGGICLAVDAENINLLDILQLTEGQRIKRECLLGLKDCDDASACVMHCDWKPIKQELTENLGRYTLATLATLASGEMPAWMGRM